MFCPRGCGNELAQANRQGVSIDYCPRCQGVWLDRGELDKIIEMSTQQGVGHLMPPPGSHPGQSVPPPHHQPQPGYGHNPYHRHDDDDDDWYVDKHGRRRRKREGWFGEMFDIFD